MSDRDGWDDDPGLRERLRAADPASSLPTTDPARVARLLEDIMSNPTDTESGTEVATESRTTGTHDRGPLTWLVAAAAVLLIAGVGVFGILNHDSSTDVPAADGTVTTLRAPGAAAYQARCMVPTAQALAQQTLAFDGTVTDIAGDRVTLTPSRFYAGNPTDEVVVEAPQADLRALIQAVKFEEGGRYLVSATSGQVTACGFSASYDKHLASLYSQAFTH